MNEEIITAIDLGSSKIFGITGIKTIDRRILEVLKKHSQAYELYNDNKIGYLLFKIPREEAQENISNFIKILRKYLKTKNIIQEESDFEIPFVIVSNTNKSELADKLNRNRTLLKQNYTLADIIQSP